jgi:protein ImuB
MPLAEAVVLIRSSPLPYDPAADRAALGRLAERCEQFSPVVGWDTIGQKTTNGEQQPGKAFPWFGESPGHLFLDVTGIAPLFGGEDTLTRLIAAECQEAGYVGRVAIADTVGAAWAVAESGESATIVPHNELEAALRPLSISTLRLPVDVLDILAQLGVLTIDQLLRLERVALAERFAGQLLVRLDQALGATPEVIVPHRPPSEYRAAVELDFPTERREEIDALTAQLIDRIVADLRARGAGVVRLAIQFDYVPTAEERHETRDTRHETQESCLVSRVSCLSVTVGLFRPTASPEHLHELVRLRCERLVLPGPVERVQLLATHTAPLEFRQHELFPDAARDADHQVGPLVERLGSRLGAHAIVRPQLRDDPLPERAFGYEPVLAVSRSFVAAGFSPRESQSRGLKPAATKKRLKERLKERLSGGDRPLRLFAPPIPIETLSVVPDGPPVAFLWQRQRHKVARHWGPERIETGWWRQGLVRRDYYRIETDTGCRLWLFRDLTDGSWHLHGSFE